ncbi:hypothetical protein J6590_085998 [Homalodisca vitripennis]|nr:hypothetical protein J6590_085998 [Homalodisca vitripennis]
MSTRLLHYVTVKREEVTALFDEVDFLEADVFIQPPENPLLSDEDSGDDGDTDFTHFTGNQLRGAAELKAKQFTNDEKGHDATGTIKANRVENVPLKEATVLKKESRGSYDQLTEQKQTYFQKYTPQRQRASRVSVTGKERVEESVRLSNSLHVLETNPTQILCGLCRKNTWKKCKQCLVVLFDEVLKLNIILVTGNQVPHDEGQWIVGHLLGCPFYRAAPGVVRLSFVTGVVCVSRS